MQLSREQCGELQALGLEQKEQDREELEMGEICESFSSQADPGSHLRI